MGGIWCSTAWRINAPVECNHGLSKACLFYQMVRFSLISRWALIFVWRSAPFLYGLFAFPSWWKMRVLGVYHFLSSGFTAQPLNVALEVAIVLGRLKVASLSYWDLLGKKCVLGVAWVQVGTKILQVIIRLWYARFAWGWPVHLKDQKYGEFTRLVEWHKGHGYIRIICQREHVVKWTGIW
jgi:hypothetical protein